MEIDSLSYYDSYLIKFYSFQNIQDFINPHEDRLLKLYENIAITVITYIIGYLQYTTDDIVDYHYNLLLILDRLLHNLPPDILAKCNNFASGTL